MSERSSRLPHLPWLRVFEAAARLENFSAAARELGLTQAAISQQIGHLEAELGERLFERKRRGVALTAAGAAFLPHVQSAFSALARSANDLFGARANTRINLRCPISFTLLWLGPRLHALQRDLPHIGLSIRTVHLPADQDDPDADFDIRFGTGTFAGRVASRLTTETLVPVAAPPAPDDMREAMRTLPLLGVIGAREMWASWFAAAGLPYSRPPLHRFDSFAAALSAAEAGSGILLGSRPLIDAHLDDGRLVRLAEVELRGEAGHFLTWPPGQPPEGARAELLDWLTRA